jgi:hypothetical protein
MDLGMSEKSAHHRGHFLCASQVRAEVCLHLSHVRGTPSAKRVTFDVVVQVLVGIIKEYKSYYTCLGGVTSGFRLEEGSDVGGIVL